MSSICPTTRRAYHAGDGKAGPGNTTSIGIEICVNAGGDFEAAKANAAALVRLLMEEHGIPLDNVVQHNRWNGKDCPKTIRATARGLGGVPGPLQRGAGRRRAFRRCRQTGRERAYQ